MSMSFEQYVAWAASRYPGYREEESESDEFFCVQRDACPAADTEAPTSDESCPVTVRSSRDGYVVVTPRIKRSV